MSIGGFASHFLTSYCRALPRILYRSSLGCLLNPRESQNFVHEVLEACDLGHDDPVLSSVNITDIFPGEEEVILKGPFQVKSTSETRNLFELGCLAHAVRSLQSRQVFELGTFIGRTSRMFALNTPADARILTLDLPQDRVLYAVGRDFKGTPEAGRITQLFGDTRTFDFSPWHATCDFVWVDACHDYEYVVIDTNRALTLAKPGGWIGWHDYRHTARWSGVTHHVREVASQFRRIHHIRGTVTVLAQVKE